MRIDERGRRAGASLRTQIGQVDVDSNLDALLVSVRRRQYLRTAAGVAAAAVVVIGGLTVRDAVTRADVPPTTTPTSSTEPAGQCHEAFLQCEAGGRYTVRMGTQMTWTLPADFGRNLENNFTNAQATRALMIESYRSDPHLTAGVTVATGVLAARMSPDGSGVVVADTRAPSDAHGLATWLSSRPYFIASDVTQATVDGNQAWTVRVRMRQPRHDGPTACAESRFSCTPVLALPGASPSGLFLGSWGTIVSDYTFVDLRGVGTAAIWSWSFSRPKALSGNQALIDSIRFGDDRS
jgi:hypothetical protein